MFLYMILQEWHDTRMYMHEHTHIHVEATLVVICYDNMSIFVGD